MVRPWTKTRTERLRDRRHTQGERVGGHRDVSLQGSPPQRCAFIMISVPRYMYFHIHVCMHRSSGGACVAIRERMSAMLSPTYPCCECRIPTGTDWTSFVACGSSAGAFCLAPVRSLPHHITITCSTVSFLLHAYVCVFACAQICMYMYVYMCVSCVLRLFACLNECVQGWNPP